MKRPKKADAFTLAEILISIALAGSVLVAAMSYFFSITNLWGQIQKDVAFVDHSKGAHFFLQSMMREARVEDESAKWEHLPGETDYAPYYLTLKQKEAAPFFYWDTAHRLTGLTAHWVHNKDGLSLAWYPDIERFGDADQLYLSRISPSIKKVSYLYYDGEADQWDKKTETPKASMNETPKAPDLITLQFEDNENVETYTLMTYQAFKQGLPY